jgi:diadenosine tetraphosphate (Ap4A) HIT family hydrolase
MKTECIFCDGKLEKFLIRKFAHWTVYLNENQYFLGRVYIVLNRHGPESTTELTEKEWQEYKEVIDRISKIVQTNYNYDLMNYATLQNRDRNHFHLHLIPRYRSQRKINNVEFKDELWNKPPFPTPNNTTDIETLIQIKKEIQKQL